MKALKRFFTEYIALNFFIFALMGLLSLLIVNIGFFDPFTQAFEDFRLTDLYYSKIKNRDSIYKGPLVLVNIEQKNRAELSKIFERIQTGKPAVVGLDVIFRGRKDTTADNQLRLALQKNRNYVFSYIAAFEPDETAVYTDSFFKASQQGYANLVGNDRQTTTIRHYYPSFTNQQSFTNAILKAYKPELLQRNDKNEMEIHYWGNLSNFRFYNATEIEDPAFDPSVFEGKIVLAGYLGSAEESEKLRIDEDKFFTPLNDRLSGRSYPDMYGTVIHANILRMLLEKDEIQVVPRWKVVIISSLIIWLLLPFMTSLFLKGNIWFNAIGTLIQLAGSILVVFIAILLYRFGNIKFDPGLLTACLVLLPTFINLYEAFLIFLRIKLKLIFQSQFLKNDA